MRNAEELQRLVHLVGQESAGLAPPISAGDHAELAEVAKAAGIDSDSVNALIALLDVCNGQQGTPLLSYFNLCEAKIIKGELAYFQSQGHRVVPFAWASTKEY